jgi:nitroimidazol reductase NimA-like FMN-containing flavoprotein (pyridoxamine 5'-phosphate oxidase superfamily)
VTVKLPKMKEDEIKKVIKEQMLCRIAFKGKNYPYMAPFQYVYMNDTLYFHFTDYGRKMQFLERDKRVCVEIEKYQPDMSEYNFVVLRGSIEIVNDTQERSRVIKKMAEDGKRKLSRNFLAAHGFKKEEGWSALSPEKPLVIVKLTDIVEEIGLKSPSLQ